MSFAKRAGTGGTLACEGGEGILWSRLLVAGARRQADEEREALARFLHEELRLELSAEKTLITRPEDGFVFLGYRVIRAPSVQSGGDVGKMRIPKVRLKSLRPEFRLDALREERREC